MNFGRVWAVCRKEIRHLIRDPRSLGMALLLPLLLLLMFGYALNLDIDRISTLIYDADRSPASRDLIALFEGSHFFSVEGRVSSYQEIERAIDRNRVLMGVVIPNNYSARIAADRRADVQILVDGSDSNTALIALGYARTVIQNFAFQLRSRGQQENSGIGLSLPVEARTRIWYNATLDSRNFIVPGLIAVILMIIGSLLTSMTIAREWEAGTMEQLLSTPLRPAELVLGKMSAFFLVGTIDTAISVFIALQIFHVPLRGSPFLLALSSVVFLCCTMCWGLFLSAVAKSQLVAYQLAMFSSFLPGFMLSGLVYLIENMPLPVQWITYAVPARYLVKIMRSIFQKGVGVDVLLSELLFLGTLSVIVFIMATRALQQKVR